MTERESDTYRRGLSLGLTMAEIFILILFLLLLVLLALYAFNAETEEKLQDAKETATQLEEKLAATKKQLQDAKKAGDQLEAELIAIRNQIDSPRSLSPEEIEHLIRVNESLTTALSNAEKENATIVEQLKGTEEQQTQTKRELSTMKDVQAVIDDNQRPGESLADTAKRLQNTYQENDEIRKENSRLHTENKKLRDKVKGIDPPCWYKVSTRNGERHESPYYLMDVAVYNEYLQVRMREAPQGYALDESKQKATTSYQEEYDKLPLPPSGTSKKVSLQQFAEITEPIKRMGKNKQIRDYACVFYAKVWDFTSATAKIRWKKAEDIIKANFYILRINNDPWAQTNQ